MMMESDNGTEKRALDRLRTEVEGIPLYMAGLPMFERVFARDMIISALLFRDTDMLKESLRFCASKQGTKKDKLTGEEPGKIFHEWPGVTLDGRGEKLSTYNASETTALFIIGILEYERMTGDASLRSSLSANITKAMSYILRHVDDRGLFIEDPLFSGAERYALRVTYWKDSHMSGREGGEPIYPVVYPLVHIQYISAIRMLSKILKDDSITALYKRMRDALPLLLDDDGILCLASDKGGMIRGISSDLLHSLFYLERDDLRRKELQGLPERFAEASEVLETPIGYRTLDPSLSGTLTDEYHASTVWPFEQAIIHKAALKFGMDHVAEVASRVKEVIKDSDAEIFKISETNHEPGGCDPQLWTIAAKKHFGLF